MTSKQSMDGKSLQINQIGNDAQLYVPPKPRGRSVLDHMQFNAESHGSPVKHLPINQVPKNNEKKVRSHSRSNLEGLLKFN